MMSYQRDESGLALDAAAYNQYSNSISTWHDNYRYTKSTLTELENFFKARAELEEEFAQRLQNLAQQPFGESESGDTILALKVVKKELIETAASHKKLSLRIREELQQPTLKQADELSKLKRQQVKNFLSKQQSHFNSLAILERAKERCQEAKQIGSNEFRNSADTELQLAFARLDDISHNLKIETNNSAEGFQQLEFNRLQFIRNAIWKYTNLLSAVCVTDDKGLERVRGSLEKIDVKKGAEAFLSTSLYTSESNQEAFLKSSQPNSQELGRLSFIEEKALFKDSLTLRKNHSLNNEIDKPSDPQINQLVSLSESDMANSSIIHEKSPITSIPARSKIISSELITATIARSPILAAKRTSTYSRPSPQLISQHSTLPAVAPETDQSLAMAHNSQSTERIHNEQQIDSQIISQSATNSVSSEYAPDSNLQRSYSGSPQNTSSQYHSQVQYLSPSNSNHTPRSYRHTSTPPQGYTERYSDKNVPVTSNGNLHEQFKAPVSSAPQIHPVAPSSSLDKSQRPDSRPILFYVRAVYDYETDNPEEIALREGQVIAVFATQLDGWWEGQVHDAGTFRCGIFPSNFTEPVSL